MTDNLPAVPVDYRSQIHVPMRHGNIGDVDGPDLIGEDNFVVPQQIRHDGLLLIPLG